MTGQAGRTIKYGEGGRVGEEDCQELTVQLLPSSHSGVLKGAAEPEMYESC